MASSYKCPICLTDVRLRDTTGLGCSGAGHQHRLCYGCSDKHWQTGYHQGEPPRCPLCRGPSAIPLPGAEDITAGDLTLRGWAEGATLCFKDHYVQLDEEIWMQTQVFAINLSGRDWAAKSLGGTGPPPAIGRNWAAAQKELKLGHI